MNLTDLQVELRASGHEAQSIMRAAKVAVEETSSGNRRERWQVGDIIKFGNYPQGANGEVMSIEWQVLFGEK